MTRKDMHDRPLFKFPPAERVEVAGHRVVAGVAILGTVVLGFLLMLGAFR